MTTNALTNFADGDVISATTTNENNQYLLSQITANGTNTKEYVDGKIATVNSSVTNTKNELIGIFNTLASSGTISLTTNSVNTITPSGAVTFSLPNVASDTKLNQILVQVNLTTVVSINVGTTHYFNSKTPNLSSVGKYNLVYEYDEANNYWVCGWMKKG